jgi:hypothetical protein
MVAYPVGQSGTAGKETLHQANRVAACSYPKISHVHPATASQPIEQKKRNPINQGGEGRPKKPESFTPYARIETNTWLGTNGGSVAAAQ